MFDSILVQFIVLWAVIDPIGSIPVYLTKTMGLSTADKHKIARKAVLIAGGVLIFFLVAGQFLLEAMKIRLTSFQVAGGLILFLFALTMIFGNGKTERELHMKSDINELAVYPLAIPSIASPGAMLSVVLLTDNHRFSLIDQTITALVTIMVLAVTYVLLLAATRIQKLIGNTGAAIISQVMGMILAAVAMNNVLAGLGM